MKPATVTQVICPYCRGQAAHVTGETIYPGRPDLVSKRYWHCDPCGAWAPCHDADKRRGFDGTQPSARMANEELRVLRKQALASLARLAGGQKVRLFFSALAFEMGMRERDFDPWRFDEQQCRDLAAAAKRAIAARAKGKKP